MIALSEKQNIVTLIGAVKEALHKKRINFQSYAIFLACPGRKV